MFGAFSLTLTLSGWEREIRRPPPGKERAVASAIWFVNRPPFAHALTMHFWPFAGLAFLPKAGVL